MDHADPWSPTPAQAQLLFGLTEEAATHDLPAPELLETGATRLARLVGSSCIFSLLSDDGAWLHPLGVADADPEVLALLEEFGDARLRADSSMPHQVLDARRSLRLVDPAPAELVVRRPELAPYVERFGVSSMILAPMRVRGRPVGAAAVLRRGDAAPHTADDERFVQAVSDWLGIVVESAARPGTGRTSADLGVEPPDLSEREREVVALLALGHTNREVAERLVLSVRTVEWHRARIHFKLGVSGRAALAREARALGIVD